MLMLSTVSLLNTKHMAVTSILNLINKVSGNLGTEYCGRFRLSILFVILLYFLTIAENKTKAIKKDSIMILVASICNEE